MLSRSGIQALKAVVALAELPPATYAGAAAIARQTGAPENYLGKLLRQLAWRGLLASRKGLGGGFRLARRARDIAVYDVIELTDNPARWGGCLLGNGRCNQRRPCGLHRRWTGVRDGYLELLRETTIADLLGSGAPGPRRIR